MARSKRPPGRTRAPAPPKDDRSGRVLLAVNLFSAFLVISWVVYRPALHGPLISDDLRYLLSPYVVELSWSNVAAILDPTSQATRSLSNYAPLRALINAVEYRYFGRNYYGYHVVNLVLHSLACVLLFTFFRSARIPPIAAGAGTIVFLVHPANVEAVAWMSQVWSPLALALTLGALLARKRTWVGSGLFGLALLGKPLAALALPVAVTLEWSAARREGRGLRSVVSTSGRWLAPWSVVLLLYAVIEFAVFLTIESGAPTRQFDDVWMQGRTILAFAARYLLLATTGIGCAAFHEPPRADSVLDPWWIAGLLLVGTLAWCTLAGLRRGSVAAAFLVWAGAAFAPVSQFVPFLYPMADRYLYFILPGLIGAALCGVIGSTERLAERTRSRVEIALVVVVAVVAVGFAFHGHERAAIWQSPAAVMADAARRYPDGMSAHMLRAGEAGRRGDVEATVVALQASRERGWDYFNFLLVDPSYRPVRDDPRFQAFLRELAGDWIERNKDRRWVTQLDLQALALAYEVHGEIAQAIAVLDRALELSGPLDAELRARRGRLRAATPPVEAP